MVLLLKMIFNFLTAPNPNLAIKHGPAVEKLPFTGSFLPVLLIQLAYLAFVLKIGPRFMKNRKPFDLKNVMLVYNLFQIIVNFAVAIGGFYGLWKYQADFGCIEQYTKDHPANSNQVLYSYVFYILKYVDLLDTVFFVLRKSYKQVTVLHVYHHMIMVNTCYAYVKSVGFGGHSNFYGLLNSVVHGFMYTYYLLSAFRNEAKLSLGWKKYITILQLVQFILIGTQQAWPLLFRSDCSQHKFWCIAGVLQSAVMLVLFSKFYVKTYMKSTDNQKSK